MKQYQIHTKDAAYPRVAELFTPEALAYYREHHGIEIEISERSKPLPDQTRLLLIDRLTPEDMEWVQHHDFVILSTVDHTALLPREQAYIHHPRCQRWIAGSIYRPDQEGWYLQPCHWGQEPTLNQVALYQRHEFSGAYFLDEQRLDRGLMRPDHIAKIRLGICLLPYDQLAEHVHAPLPFAERTHDACFLGSIDSYGSLGSGDELPTTIHRRRCVEAMQALSDTYAIVADGKNRTPAHYYATLHNSRCVVSPWGLGAWAWRDYEAIAAGCILIKPRTDHIQLVPDIYDVGRVRWCRPDYADLGDVLAGILAEPWAEHDLRAEMALSAYESATSPARLHALFAEALQ